MDGVAFRSDLAAAPPVCVGIDAFRRKVRRPLRSVRRGNHVDLAHMTLRATTVIPTLPATFA